MYGEKENSYLPRLFLIFNHLAAVLIAAWLLFGGGIETVANWFGFSWTAGDFWRRILLLSCSIIYFLRIVITSFVLIARKMDWSESLIIVVWLYILHSGFALLGGTEQNPIGFLAIFGFILYLFGSYLNTASEYLRKIWKENAENKGKLYTGGLFRYSIHINYFGDFVLFTGFAMITRNIFAFVFPLLMFCGFVFINIPMLDKYLAEKYGNDFEEYRRRTKKFVPFVY